MTEKQIISTLKELTFGTVVGSKGVEALDMAIKALSQEPCERFEWGIDGNVYKITKAKDGKEICQQVCKDAISREAVIMECIKYADHEHNVRLKEEVSETRKHDAQVIIYACDYFKTFVEKLPPVTQKSGKWISVSERLPEDGIYLVTVEITVGESIVDIKSFANDLNKVDEFDFPKQKCGWYDYDGEYGYWEATNVIAWMPLPESYKAESEE